MTFRNSIVEEINRDDNFIDFLLENITDNIGLNELKEKIKDIETKELIKAIIQTIEINKNISKKYLFRYLIKKYGQISEEVRFEVDKHFIKDLCEYNCIVDCRFPDVDDVIEYNNELKKVKYVGFFTVEFYQFYYDEAFDKWFNNIKDLDIHPYALQKEIEKYGFYIDFGLASRIDYDYNNSSGSHWLAAYGFPKLNDMIDDKRVDYVGIFTFNLV